MLYITRVVLLQLPVLGDMYRKEQPTFFCGLPDICRSRRVVRDDLDGARVLGQQSITAMATLGVVGWALVQVVFPCSSI